MTKPLRTVRLTITATVLEAQRGAIGPAALLHWSDGRGFAIVAACAAWSSEAAAGLAAVEIGDRIILAGEITDTARRPWLSHETLLMRVERIEAPRQLHQQATAVHTLKAKP